MLHDTTGPKRGCKRRSSIVTHPSPHGLQTLGGVLFEKIDLLAGPGRHPGELYTVSKRCYAEVRHRLRTMSVPFTAVCGYRTSLRDSLRRITGVPGVEHLLSVEGLALDKLTHVYFTDDCKWGANDSLESLPQLRVLRAHGARPSMVAHNRSLQHLDLGVCHHLRDLTELIPARHSLVSLRLHSRHLRDISVLQGFQKLTDLALSACVSLENISALGLCRRLTTLDLRGCGLTDITALAVCRQLTTLDLSMNTSLVDISTLAACPRLATLYLVDTGICDTASLAHCPELTTLDVRYSSTLRDISALGSCPLLARLYLTECHALETIGPLVRCQRLQHLDIVGCSDLTDLDAIGLMGSLTLLRLDAVVGVPMLPGLTTLQVFTGHCVDFRLFPGLTALTIDSTIQVDLDGIRDCTQLRNLTLLDCEYLVDVSAIMGCTELTTLRIASCPRLHYVAVSGHPSLQHLQITSCGELYEVEAEDCPRLASTEITHCRSIEFCSLHRNPAMLSTVVSECPRLQEVV